MPHPIARRPVLPVLLMLPALLALLACAVPAPARADEAFRAALREPGAAVLMRHATAPGIGDPEGFRLDDCATQRNLDASGRAEARQLGARLRAQGLAVGAVLHSRWCRTRDTAQLAFGGRPGVTIRPEPAFDSFFAGQGDAAAQTNAARAILAGWRGPGVLVVVTHQVNISALTGESPASGEAFAVVPGAADGAWRVRARLRP